jgi:hypothetical protein
MQLEGNILKMRTELATPVKYFLPVGQNEISMNDLIGKEISMNFTGQINCISCGKQTKTSFSQGFCYNCLQTAPEASESVIQPRTFERHTLELPATWNGQKNTISSTTLFIWPFREM